MPGFLVALAVIGAALGHTVSCSRSRPVRRERQQRAAEAPRWAADEREATPAPRGETKTAPDATAGAAPADAVADVAEAPTEVPPEPEPEPAPPPPEGWSVTRRVAEFDRAWFRESGLAELIRKHGNLKPPGKCVTGWLEFDVEVPGTGWYEFLVEPDCVHCEYIIDGKLSIFGQGPRREENDGREGKTGKVDNVWLTRGEHTIRLQREIWWGFGPAISGFTLLASGPGVAKRARIEYAHGDGVAVLRRGESLKFTVHAGQLAEPTLLRVLLRGEATGHVLETLEIELPAAEELVEVEAAVPCRREGTVSLSFAEDERTIPRRDLRRMRAFVADTTPVPREGGVLGKTLLQEIDCVATEPDYVGVGGTNVVRKPFGSCRESGAVGFLAAQHRREDCSWFAYRMATPHARKPHVVEFDYPDDTFRTFVAAVREASPAPYPVASGPDTGGCWTVSNGMHTQSILFWPWTGDLRLVLVTPHDGRRAAASKIRLYRVDDIPLLDVPESGGRTYAHWYEEGSNFLGIFGAAGGGLADIWTGADRWARSVAHMGGSMLVPTVSVYQMNLYPSRYNVDFTDMSGTDTVRMILMACEKYGLKFVAEFHPEARELDHTLAVKRNGERPNGLVSRKGERRDSWKGVPRHHPLHPVNRTWYLGMIGEFVDRYRDSPALAGVSLRLMTWANPALNNFHSLEWGYDDLTTELFEEDTGVRIPAEAADAARFARRYDWLMANAREKWISWRCEKIAEIYTDVRDRVRQARPDLKVYSDNFGVSREAGVDPGLLTAIDGVCLINCRHSYGRRRMTYEGPLSDPRMRDNLVDPAVMRSMLGGFGEPAFMFGAGYFEATEVVVPPAKLGFPANTKHGWMSGVVNPTGRHYLERFALALAETDARYLADGGNAYTLGQPLLREFLAEYRWLPPVAFAPRDDARDPVAVWELKRPDDFLFHAVNRERFPVTVTIRLRRPGKVKGLATGKPALLKAGVLRVELKPYELVTFQAGARASIRSVSVRIPAEDRRKVEAQVRFIAVLAEDSASGRLSLEDHGGKLLAKAAEEAQAALELGHVWRARTLLEHHQLIEHVYQKAKRHPPHADFPPGR